MANLQTTQETGIQFGGMSYTLDGAFKLAVQFQIKDMYNEAIEIYRLILSKAPRHLASLNNLALLIFQRHDVEQAIRLYRHAIALKPDYADALHNLGDALVSKGNLEEAEKMFRRALAVQKHRPKTLYSLAYMRKYGSSSHPDVRKIKKLLGQPSGTNDIEYLYFALGKIYDDCGLYDEAFESYEKANKICNARLNYTPEMTTREVDSFTGFFNKEFLSQKFPFSSASRQPLFIIGMPRSGTTLVANILSNHASIGAAGELVTMMEYIINLPQIVGSAVPYPEAVKYISNSTGAAMVENYERRLRLGLDANLPYVIDKHPLNFWHLGFISMLFPKAKIIHCRRDPVDTCLSNYFQCFSLQYQYAFDLGNIGGFYKQYERIMHHWRKALPMEMLEVNYEDVVRDTEHEIRKMLNFLGLEWDDACLSPHKNPRPVKTSSVWQVRQPVYKQSVARWRNYKKHLGPLEALLDT